MKQIARVINEDILDHNRDLRHRPRRRHHHHRHHRDLLIPLDENVQHIPNENIIKIDIETDESIIIDNIVDDQDLDQNDGMYKSFFSHEIITDNLQFNVTH